VDEAHAAPGTVTTSSTTDGAPRRPDGRGDPRATARRRRVRLQQRYVFDPPARLATRLGGGLRRRWYQGRRPHWSARLLNRLSAAQFAAGVLSPARAVTLEVRGRRSGRTVSLPVVVADHDGGRYLVAMLGERAQWVQNVRAAGGRAVLRRRGREEVRLEEVEPDARAPVLRRYLALAPGARAHVPVDRRAPLAEFERVAPSFPVFRVVPWAASDEEPAGATARPDVSPTPRTRHRTPRPEVDGVVSPGFEPVRDAFVANLTERHELGGAVCAVVDGEVVVDLWGGLRDAVTGAPWRRDTMTLVHSSTKGLSAAVLALLHSRGLLDYDERVATYWPEFAQAGKEDITVRRLLAHQAGLFAFDERVDRDVVADLDRLAGVMESQRPAWPPGERQAYHAITLGFYENELVRRLDPGHRTIGRVLAEDVVGPLGVGEEVYLGTPTSVPDERLAALVPPPLWARVTGMPLRLTLDAMRRRSVLYRSLVANPGTGFYVDPEHVIVRELEVPSGGAVATARALATVYGAFASADGPLELRPETLEALAAPATPPRRGWYDECLRGPARFSLGFMKPDAELDFGSDAAFGAPGAGGSMGFADPARRLGYGYVTDRMGTRLQGDPRDLALRAALGTVLARAA
jgi:deazaflavin-dependent oxidoreductase (nitroreductase family)